jgi:phage-related protein (TIGR01555 family)
MFRKIIDYFKPPAAAPVKKKKPKKVFNTDLSPHISVRRAQEMALSRVVQRTASEFTRTQDGAVMDSAGSNDLKPVYDEFCGLTTAQLLYYASFSFIGYQLCALIGQHWLVDKACSMPARDAIRKGYEITTNDGTEITSEMQEAMRKADVKYRLNHHLVQFVRFGRMFGIRIAMFRIEGVDADFYAKPFNIDGIKPGSYKGIVQIDPQWITPELDGIAASDPTSPYFYEPTWWNINGSFRIHRSHLIIMRTDEVPDLLKPTYFYGGVPLPQRICERIYGAERTANEAPQLALSKRSVVFGVDDANETLANQAEFESKMRLWAEGLNNFGVKVVSKNDTLQQFDTSLADLDNVIMSQYQLVAAIAHVPAVKLLGTSPKGFNATGEFEESSYHEELESIQTHDLTPLIERHHLLLIKSEIAPKFNVMPFTTEVKWKPLDAITEKEQAEINLLKAQEAKTHSEAGAIDGSDIRKRLVADPNSGYTGMSEEMPEDDEDLLGGLLGDEETAQEPTL